MIIKLLQKQAYFRHKMQLKSLTIYIKLPHNLHQITPYFYPNSMVISWRLQCIMNEIVSKKR